MQHEFVEMLNSRWCRGCVLVQHRTAQSEPWRPHSFEDCPRNSAFLELMEQQDGA